MSELTRRAWLDSSLKTLLAGGMLAGAGTGLAGTELHGALHGKLHEKRQSAENQPAAPEIAIFTKSFQGWPLEQVCQKFAELGVTGLDLTVRPGGHILPGEIETKLPAAARIAAAHGLKIVQITSNVTDPDDYGKTLFKTAGELGIRYIKLGYYRTPSVGDLQAQIENVKGRLRSLGSLGQKHSVLPCVHIHSGTFLPSHGTLLYLLLQDIDPEEVGAYVDTLHMSLEGGAAGWKHGLDLLAPWIRMCAVKNYLQTQKSRDQYGQQLWGWKNAPLAEGVSPIPEFLKTLQLLNYRGPFSLHSEYLPELTIDECFTQTAADLAFFRTLPGIAPAV